MPRVPLFYCSGDDLRFPRSGHAANIRGMESAPIRRSTTPLIVIKHNVVAGHWCASFANTPGVGFTGELPVVAIRRLLEGLNSPADSYALCCDREFSGSGVLPKSVVWDSSELLFPCAECNGSGEYIGLMEREPCKVCHGLGLVVV